MANASDKSTPVTRETVYQAIDSERTYQGLRWGKQESKLGALVEPQHSVCDFLVYMQDYLREAMTECARTPGVGAALEIVRKVTALGVACMEEHGAPVRNLEGGVANRRDGCVRG